MGNQKRKTHAVPIFTEQTYKTEESIGFLLGRCLTGFTDAIDQSLNDFGLRSQQFGVLHAIYKGQARTPGDLTRLRFQNSAAIAYTLDVLESRQLLTRTRSAKDRRGIELSLTPEGRAVTKASIPRVVEAQNRMLEDLNFAEYEALGALLLRIAARVGI